MFEQGAGARWHQGRHRSTGSASRRIVSSRPLQVSCEAVADPCARCQCRRSGVGGIQHCASKRAAAIIAAGLGGIMLQLQSAFGVLALLAIAFAFGENRRSVSLRQAAIGLFVTLLTAIVLIKLPIVAHAFGVINDAVGAISSASRAGTSFVFGYLGGGALPFDLKAPGADFILAFQALPVVLVMSVLTTLLFYWRILPPVVRGMAWLLERTLGVGGAVGLSTAANIFLGMVEAPLVHPAVSGATDAQRIVPGDDGRHGRHRRHRAGALRHAAGAADSRRRRAFRHRLGAGRAGGDPDQPDHGAGDQRRQDRRRAWRSRDARLLHHGRDRQGHRRRPRTPAQHRRDADRAGGAGLSRQRHSGTVARYRRGGFRCSGCSATSWRRCAG